MSAIQQNGTWVYVGTYTNSLPFVQGKSPGIIVCRLEMTTGALTMVHSLAGITNPSYLVLDAAKRYLYAVEEHASADRAAGEVCALRIDSATGALSFLNRQSSHGAEPAHINLDRSGRWVLVANYGDGVVATLPVQAGGSVGPAVDVVRHQGSSVDPARQAGPHAHWIGADAGNRFVLVSDLGLDALMVYRFDAETGKLEAAEDLTIKMPPGAGPRHVVFRPDNRNLYVVNELDSTIISYSFEATGGRLVQVGAGSTLPAGYDGASSIAAVRVAPNGRFVYAANRGHNSIAIFVSDPETGVLTLIGHESTQGRTPRDFNIDPTGRYLLAANQDSNTIVTFHVDERSGRLTPTGHQAEVPTPACIEFGTSA